MLPVQPRPPFPSPLHHPRPDHPLCLHAPVTRHRRNHSFACWLPSEGGLLSLVLEDDGCDVACERGLPWGRVCVYAGVPVVVGGGAKKVVLVPSQQNRHGQGRGEEEFEKDGGFRSKGADGRCGAFRFRTRILPHF